MTFPASLASNAVGEIVKTPKVGFARTAMGIRIRSMAADAMKEAPTFG